MRDIHLSTNQMPPCTPFYSNTDSHGRPTICLHPTWLPQTRLNTTQYPPAYLQVHLQCTYSKLQSRTASLGSCSDAYSHYPYCLGTYLPTDAYPHRRDPQQCRCTHKHTNARNAGSGKSQIPYCSCNACLRGGIDR